MLRLSARQIKWVSLGITASVGVAAVGTYVSRRLAKVAQLKRHAEVCSCSFPACRLHQLKASAQ